MSPSKIITLTVIIAALVSYFALKPSGVESPTTYALPWQIQLHDDGTSTVFGITLERTTVKELLESKGEDHELAIISDSNDQSGLEIYFSHFSIGPLQGKLIARVDANQQQLEAMQSSASVASYTSSGSRKFLLSESDLETIQNWTIGSLSYLPSASLDEDIILERFGSPEERISQEEGIEHFLYPDKGLDIALNSEGKELLQYVAPRNFESLTLPFRAFATQE
ncbi:MAG: hypothetical protein ACRBBW_02780 [Cellvibrionaceae bacterium]